jgi:hypothetical protein
MSTIPRICGQERESGGPYVEGEEAVFHVMS